MKSEKKKLAQHKLGGLRGGTRHKTTRGLWHLEKKGAVVRTQQNKTADAAAQTLYCNKQPKHKMQQIKIFGATLNNNCCNK